MNSCFSFLFTLPLEVFSSSSCARVKEDCSTKNVCEREQTERRNFYRCCCCSCKLNIVTCVFFPCKFRMKADSCEILARNSLASVTCLLLFFVYLRSRKIYGMFRHTFDVCSQDHFVVFFTDNFAWKAEKNSFSTKNNKKKKNIHLSSLFSFSSYLRWFHSLLLLNTFFVASDAFCRFFAAAKEPRERFQGALAKTKKQMNGMSDCLALVKILSWPN